MIIFKDWLKEKGALEEYEKYFDESYNDFDYSIPTSFIDMVFCWDASDSGEDYWLKISQEWDDVAYNSDNIIYFSKDYVPETPVTKDNEDFGLPKVENYPKMPDVKPIQYQIGIDTFDRMKANASFEEIIGGCKLNIDKYIWRKKGSDREDLIKAKDYIDLWIWALDNKNEKDK